MQAEKREAAQRAFSLHRRGRRASGGWGQWRRRGQCARRRERGSRERARAGGSEAGKQGAARKQRRTCAGRACTRGAGREPERRTWRNGCRARRRRVFATRPECERAPPSVLPHGSLALPVRHLFWALCPTSRPGCCDPLRPLLSPPPRSSSKRRCTYPRGRGRVKRRLTISHGMLQHARVTRGPPRPLPIRPSLSTQRWGAVPRFERRFSPAQVSFS